MKYEVTVKPGAKREAVQVDGAKITIYTHARAHDGEANAAVIAILSKHFHTPKTSIKILQGAKSKHKLVDLP